MFLLHWNRRLLCETWLFTIVGYIWRKPVLTHAISAVIYWWWWQRWICWIQRQRQTKVGRRTWVVVAVQTDRQTERERHTRRQRQRAGQYDRSRQQTGLATWTWDQRELPDTTERRADTPRVPLSCLGSSYWCRHWQTHTGFGRFTNWVRSTQFFWLSLSHWHGYDTIRYDTIRYIICTEKLTGKLIHSFIHFFIATNVKRIRRYICYD